MVSPPVLVSAVTLFLLFMIFVLPVMSGRLSALTGYTVSPDTSFIYSPAELVAMAEAYGPEGRAYYVFSRFTFDLAWPAVYLFFMTSLTTYLLRHLPVSSSWRMLNLLPLAGALFDLLENGAASTVMLLYPYVPLLAAALAPIFTFLKWVTIGLSFAVILVGLGLAVKRILKR